MGFLFSFFGLGSLRSKIFAIGLVLALVAAGAWAIKQKLEISSVKEEAVQYQRERDQANTDRDKAIDANTVSQETIKKMQDEKRDINESLLRLEAARKADAVQIGKISKIIENQANNPANMVQLSPVLQQVVQEIQAQHTQRTGPPQ